MKFGFKVDLEALSKRMKDAATSPKSGPRKKYDSIPTGKSQWRILPSWSAEAAKDGIFFVSVRKHFLQKQFQKYKVIKCLIQEGTHADATCPVCDVIYKWTPPRDPEKSFKEQKIQDYGAWRFKASPMLCFNAIRRATLPNEKDYICILQAQQDLAFSLHQFQDMGQDVLDTEAGCDIQASVMTIGGKYKRAFITMPPSPAITDGPAPELYDLTQEMTIRDEDRLRAGEVAKLLDDLLLNRKKEMTPNKVEAAPITTVAASAPDPIRPLR